MGRSKRLRAGPSTASPFPPPAQGGIPIVASTGRGIEYRPLLPGSADARRLFAYAAAWVPPPTPKEIGWGAWAKAEEGGDAAATKERMVGVLLIERSGTAGMIHGPVVVEAEDPVEVATQLVAAALSSATPASIETLFARPQGLDRVWVRFGFIPVPEADLPAAFRGRPGEGLYGWRQGSALWSSRRPDLSERDEIR